MGSASDFMKKGPSDQSIFEKTPSRLLPPPISIENNPFSFVVGLWVSTYLMMSAFAPCRILILIPMSLLDMRFALLSLRTAW